MLRTNQIAQLIQEQIQIPQLVCDDGFTGHTFIGGLSDDHGQRIFLIHLKLPYLLVSEHFHDLRKNKFLLRNVIPKRGRGHNQDPDECNIKYGYL